VEKIVTETANNFIKNILEILSAGGGMEKIEIESLREVKACAAKFIGIHAEAVDAAIVEDKAIRREHGYYVERRDDKRSITTLVGEVSYSRTYFKKASGGYEYLTDTVLEVEPRSRVSDGLSLALVDTAKDVSYAKSSKYVADGDISRQTVMGKVRQSQAAENHVQQRRSVPELHIDADEAHITLVGGKRSEVPLISVYEGIGTKGKRTFCENVFHISEYGKAPDELWEQALTEIERRYDLTDTKIYLHGDGAKWIQTCFEWIPQAIFVLDKYHKNKAIKNVTAGLDKGRRNNFDAAIRQALAEEDLQLFGEMVAALCEELPERADKIKNSAIYLQNFVSGISICEKDPGANNGGCTEPHVSHILSARLSSRPMAWSKKTLVQLAPILAVKNFEIQPKKSLALELPEPLKKVADKASKSLSNYSLGMPHPNAIGTLPITGKITGTQVLLKCFT
jgi:hypothetical protein